MAEIHVTKNNFHEEVMNSKVPVLIDFWATWCMPCRMIAPVVEEIAEERTDIKVCKIDIDDQQELASMFQIMSIPTLVVLENGNIKNKAVGVQPKEEILKML